MKETLSNFSSMTLYGDGYKPATEEIAKQKLRFLPFKLSENIPEPESDFIKWALDPDYPLSVIILENTQATIENEIEKGIKNILTMRKEILHSGKTIYLSLVLIALKFAQFTII